MKTSSKLIISLVTLALLIGGLTIAYQNITGDDAQRNNGAVVQEELKPLNFRLKWLIYSSFAPHLVAQDSGFHADQGLKVTIQPGGPGLDPIKLVASGVDDVGLASYDQILIAREKGIPLIAIAEDTVKSGVGFMTLSESGIDSPEDFVGKKVGIMPGTDKGTMYEALMSKTGIDRSAITEIPVQFDLSILFNKSVDVVPAFITNQPIVADDKGFKVNVIDPWEYDIRPGGNVYFTTEANLKEKRGELVNFLRAELRGITESQKMPDEDIVDLTLKYNDKLSRTAEIRIWKATKEILLENNPNSVGFMKQETWDQTARMFFQSGLLTKLPNDYQSIYTNELVLEAKRQ